VGDSAAEGSATSFARSDHRHSREAFAGSGAATTVAHSDHTHSGLGYIDRTFANVTKANTAAAETLYSFSVPSADFASKGLELVAWGTYTNNTGVNRTLQFNVNLGGGNLFAETSAAISTAVSTRAWFLRCQVWAPGATNTETIEGFAEATMGAAAVAFFNPNVSGAAFLAQSISFPGFDVTVANTIELKSTHSAASANLSITMQGAILKAA
jgi:hypothetical protein